MYLFFWSEIYLIFLYRIILIKVNVVKDINLSYQVLSWCTVLNRKANIA